MACLIAALPALADETREMPALEDAIPPSIQALGPPAFTRFDGGVRMAVSTVSDKAQDHVNQGLNHLHGGWETEAARHFAAAMHEDPDCLLAHWGIVMALLTPSPETGPARNAATDRLLTLVERGAGSDLERGYAFGLVKYIEEGPQGAASAFRRVSSQFPNDVQAAVLAALFGRGGFDDLGKPTPDQQRSEDALTRLMEKFPDSPLPINALLTIRAEGGDVTGSLELARRLCRMVADYPPYFHLLGHFEWRSGEHTKAASAFGRATALFDQWMKEHNAAVADCPDWVRAEAYRVVAAASSGDFEVALAAAHQLAAIEVAEGREQSPGARALWWEARTLPARLWLARGEPGDAELALKSLPPPTATRDHRHLTLATWWIDGLRFALEARRLIDEGDADGARNVSAALTQHGEAMAETQLAASGGGERPAWNRAFRSLEVIAAETRGLLAMAGPEATRGTAFNWFRGAADRQQPASSLYPPAVLAPMAARLGGFFVAENRLDDAIEAYEEALASFPNHLPALAGLRDAATAAGDTERAAAAARAIQRFSGN